MKSILLLYSLLGLMAAAQALPNDPVTLDNCTEIDTCELCLDSSCHWVQCTDEDPSCQKNPSSEMCEEVSCANATTTTETPTTTEIPTTETPTDPPTTEPPPETTTTPTPAPTEPPTTPPPTEPPTTEPPTEPPTEAPTTLPPPTTTAKPCPTPDGRHFDAPSFFGGMVLAVGIVAVAYAAWRFYKSRNERNYHTL